MFLRALIENLALARMCLFVKGVHKRSKAFCVCWPFAQKRAKLVKWFCYKNLYLAGLLALKCGDKLRLSVYSWVCRRI